MTAVSADRPQQLHGLVALPIDQVHPSPNNPREHLSDIDGLAISIRENGLIQPIVVQNVPGQRGYQILAGHRRYAAVRKLGWDKVPAILRRDMLPDEELLTMLVENGQRAGLDPIEEARALKRLVDQGLTRGEVARKIGRSASLVNKRLDLLLLPVAEQEAIRAGLRQLQEADRMVLADRAEQRRRANPVARAIGRPKGAKTKPYFGDTHPLAGQARDLCRRNGHGKGHIKLPGAVACGPCWETVLRDDACVSAGFSATRPPPVYDPTPRHTCDSCGGLFAALVDDGPLCVRCDRLHHPEPLTWKASS